MYHEACQRRTPKQGYRHDTSNLWYVLFCHVGNWAQDGQLDATPAFLGCFGLA